MFCNLLVSILDKSTVIGGLSAFGGLVIAVKLDLYSLNASICLGVRGDVLPFGIIFSFFIPKILQGFKISIFI